MRPKGALHSASEWGWVERLHTAFPFDPSGANLTKPDVADAAKGIEFGPLEPSKLINSPLHPR